MHWVFSSPTCEWYAFNPSSLFRGVATHFHQGFKHFHLMMPSLILYVTGSEALDEDVEVADGSGAVASPTGVVDVKEEEKEKERDKEPSAGPVASSSSGSSSSDSGSASSSSGKDHWDDCAHAFPHYGCLWPQILGGTRLVDDACSKS